MEPNRLPVFGSPLASAPNDMLLAILDQSPDCIKVIGPEGTVDYMNRNGQRAMEIENFYDIAGIKWTSLWPESARASIEAALITARTDAVARFEAFCPTAHGTPRWWDVRVSPLLGLDSQVIGFIATSRDVTERKRFEKRLEVAADEMRQRLRNSHIAMARLADTLSSELPTVNSAPSEMVSRLRGLTMAQTLVADESDPGVLRKLIPELLDPFATAECPIRIETLPDATLNQACVDALTLVLGELAVNSTRHGALGGRGKVTVGCAVAEGRIALSWCERWTHATRRPDIGRGQGIKLLERALASREGEISFEWTDFGLDVRALLPCVTRPDSRDNA